MKTVTKGIEKIVFIIDINEYVSIYNYDTNILSVCGKDEVKSEADYVSLRDNTIQKMLSKGAKIDWTIDGIKQELPKFEKLNNYRPMARIKGSNIFQGIQGKSEDNKLGLGGNIIHHIVFWDCTKNEAEKKLCNLIDSFPEYDFKMNVC